MRPCWSPVDNVQAHQVFCAQIPLGQQALKCKRGARGYFKGPTNPQALKTDRIPQISHTRLTIFLTCVGAIVGTQ